MKCQISQYLWKLFKIFAQSIDYFYDSFNEILGTSCRHLGNIWDHFGTTLESLWDHYGAILGALWDHSKITLGLLLDYSEITPEHSGTTMGPFWDHSGVTIGHSGNTLGTLRPTPPIHLTSKRVRLVRI